MALTKISTGMLKQDAASSDLNIDAGTLYLDVSNNRVGIANTSPSQALNITGNALATGWFRGAGGSASTPTFLVDGSTGMFRASSNDIGFSTAGSERMRIDSSGGVGINRTSISSSYKLHVGGDIAIGGGGAYGQITPIESGTTGVRISGNGSGTLRLASGGVDAMYIIDGGNVGIGTSSPATMLELAADDNDGTNAPRLRITNSSTTLADGARVGTLEFHNSDTTGSGPTTASIEAITNSTDERRVELTFNPGFNGATTEAMRIDSDGNVGIGTNSPDTSLHLSAGSTSTSVLRFESTDTSLVTNQAVGVLEFEQNDGTSVAGVPTKIGAYAEDNHGSVGLRFYTGVGNTANEVVRFDHDGNVGIGNSNPDSLVHAYKASNAILKAEEANGYVSLQQSGVNSYLNNVSSGGSLIFRNGTAPTERMRIDSSGNLLVGTTTADAEGITLRGDSDYFKVVRNGGITAYFDRKTSDGDIVQFRRDGPSGVVGSIGVNSSRPYLVNNVDGGIHLSTDGYGRALLLPADQNGAPEDNLHHLGSSSYRWRDLYLSGTAYVDTVDANSLKLGDNQYIFLGDGNDGRLHFDGTDTLNITATNGTANVVNVAANSIKLVQANGTDFFTATANAEVIINEDSADINFRVESNNNANMLYVDGGNDRVAIGTNTQNAVLTIESAGNGYATGSLALKASGSGATNYITNAGGNFYISHTGTSDDFVLNANELIINENSVDRDFRVESSNQANMFRVDAGTDRIGIKLITAEPTNTLDVNGDISFARTVSKKISTGAANNNYFVIYEKDFETSAFTTNQHWVRITAAGATNGVHASAEFYITFKQQSGSKYFNIVPIENTGLNIGYTYDASGGSSSSGKLKIFASAANFYMYMQVFATAREGNADENLILGAFPMTDTGSATAPSGMTTMAFPLNYGANKYQLSGYSSKQYVINEDSNDLDFRVESNNNANMFKVDAGDGQVLIATSSPFEPSNYGLYARNGLIVGNFSGTGNGFTVRRGDSLKLNINHDSTRGFVTTGGNPLHFRTSEDANYKISMETNGVVINENGQDYDFRVESNNSAYALYVDAAQDSVGILTNATDAALNVNSQSGSKDAIRIVGSGGNNFIAGYGNQGNLSFTIAEVGADDPGVLTLYRNGIASHILDPDANSETVFNEQGENVDFRIESDGNAGMFFVDASANRIGVGTSSPDATLQVQTNHTSSDVTAANSNSTLNLGNAGSGNYVYNAIKFAANQQDMYIMAFNNNTQANRRIGFFVGSVAGDAIEDERFIIKGDGDVAVINESAAPINSVSNPGKFRIQGHGWNTNLGSRDQGWSLQSVGAYANRKSGQTYPDLRFNATTSDSVYSDTAIAKFFYDGAGYKWQVDAGAVFNESSLDSDFRVESDTDSYALFVEAGTSRVGIGRSNPQAKLDVNAGTTKGIEIALGTSSVPFINFLYGATTVGSITTTGSATVYNTSSDQRLKDNIVDAPSASYDIDAIQVRSFDWKADGSHQKYGMVAQELQSVAPEAVTSTEDPEDMMGVDYSKLVPMLVKALQESRQEINNLKSRVEQLESQ